MGATAATKVLGRVADSQARKFDMLWLKVADAERTETKKPRRAGLFVEAAEAYLDFSSRTVPAVTASFQLAVVVPGVFLDAN